MGAGGADREHLAAMAGEQDLFIADLPNQHRAIGEIAVRDSIPQVGLGRLAGLRHVTLRQRRIMALIAAARVSGICNLPSRIGGTAIRRLVASTLAAGSDEFWFGRLA
jgi:hypothetical protein